MAAPRAFSLGSLPLVEKVLVLFLLWVWFAQAFALADQQPTKEHAPKNCDIYLAPSELIGGWGVFAGRDFEPNEVIEVFPRFVALDRTFLYRTTLGDYFYSFVFQTLLINNDNQQQDQQLGIVAFGKAMFYNHATEPNTNIEYTSFGREPDYKVMPWASISNGYKATRNIKRGEELLTNYDPTGKWFTARGINTKQIDYNHTNHQTMSAVELVHHLQDREQQYCSKMVAGIGCSTWTHRILPTERALQRQKMASPQGEGPPQRPHWHFDYQSTLPLQDHPTAVATSFIPTGQTIEVSPALVVPRDEVHNSSLSPMVIYWEDLETTNQEVIQQLRERGAFWMKGINEETGKLEIDVLRYYEQVAILPAAGNVALVRKVGAETDSNPNCRLEILSSSSEGKRGALDYWSAGIVLKLIATQDIPDGTELKLNLPDSSSWETKILLVQHLALLGQPIPQHLVNAYNPQPDANANADVNAKENGEDPKEDRVEPEL